LETHDNNCVKLILQNFKVLNIYFIINMGSVSHFYNNGLLGTQTPLLRTEIPREDSRFTGINRPDTRNQQHGSLKGTDNPMRTLIDMNGGVRGVLPCCGINENNISGMGSRVLRKAGRTDTDFMNIPQGFAKSQDRGLAYDVTKPLNVAPELPIDFCHPLTMRSQFSPAPFRVSRG
jgi:hypothetical protein